MEVGCVFEGKTKEHAIQKTSDTCLSSSSSYPQLWPSCSPSLPRIREQFKEDVKDGSNHPKSDFFFPNFSFLERRRMRFDSEALFSVTDAKSADKITRALSTLSGFKPGFVISDITSCVGGSVISFARSFAKVNAVEIDPTRFDMLRHNVAGVAQCKNVSFHHGNGVHLALSSKISQDIVFVDPPWGGPDYLKTSNLHLSLSDGNCEVDLGELAFRLLNCSRTRYVAFKVPVNFAVEDFKRDLSKAGGSTIELSCLNLRKMKLLVAELSRSI